MVDLTQPAANSQDWHQPLNQNFDTIEDELNAGIRIYGMFYCHQTGPASMSIRVDAGYALGPNGLTEIAAQNAGPVAAPASNNRIDRIVSVITGTEAVTPSAPDFGITKVPLARVLLTPGQTEILDGDITDERSVVPDGDPVKLTVNGARQNRFTIEVDTTGDENVLEIKTGV